MPAAERVESTIYERGMGFPNVGDFVADPDDLYKIVAMGSRIFTGEPGLPNYVYATLEIADWGDIESDDEIFPAYVGIEHGEDHD